MCILRWPHTDTHRGAPDRRRVGQGETLIGSFICSCSPGRVSTVQCSRWCAIPMSSCVVCVDAELRWLCWYVPLWPLAALSKSKHKARSREQDTFVFVLFILHYFSQQLWLVFCSKTTPRVRKFAALSSISCICVAQLVCWLLRTLITHSSALNLKGLHVQTAVAIATSPQDSVLDKRLDSVFVLLSNMGLSAKNNFCKHSPLKGILV